MTYTVAGTLYNRFVLDLRGYDQIPQFSIESMKYHGKEAFEWTRDMIGIVALNFCSRSSGGGGYDTLPSQNPRTPNPVSHQAQVSGFAATDDLEQNGGLSSKGGGLGGSGGGFVRPMANQNRTTAFQRAQTNPVSHQFQVAQSLSFAASATSPSPPAAQAPQARIGPESRSSTKEEREFLVGGDDDDDAEELGEITGPPPVGSPLPQPSGVPGVGLTASNIAAAARGRELPGGGAIQL